MSNGQAPNNGLLMNWKDISWGKACFVGVFAIIPSIINGYYIDVHGFKMPNLEVCLGFLIQLVVSFIIGGAMGLYFNDEKDLRKLITIGLTAPGLVIALLNGNLTKDSSIELNKTLNMYNQVINENNELKQKIKAIGAPLAFYGAISLAQAQITSGTKLKEFSMRDQGPASNIWRGFTGSNPQNIWFVIAGSHLKLEDAEKQAAFFNHEMKGFNAEVYERYGGNPYYAVVIGANLTLDQAKALQNKAVQAGFPRDTYLWALPLK